MTSKSAIPKLSLFIILCFSIANAGCTHTGKETSATKYFQIFTGGLIEASGHTVYTLSVYLPESAPTFVEAVRSDSTVRSWQDGDESYLSFRLPDVERDVILGVKSITTHGLEETWTVVEFVDQNPPTESSVLDPESQHSDAVKNRLQSVINQVYDRPE